MNDAFMRFFLTSALLVLVLTGCATQQYNFEEPAVSSTASSQVDATPPSVVDRTILDAVLSDGPGRFLQRMPVTPQRQGNAFIGFRILALYGQPPDAEPTVNGVHVGDVVTAVNGISIRRPDDLMRVWNGLRNARQIVVDVKRRSKPLRVIYPIVR
jgi:type II secretory pathway component PulC